MNLPLSSSVPERPHQPLPRNAGMIPLALFLASLTMLFVALMIGYVLIRLRPGNPEMDIGTLPLGAIKLPVGLWISTVLLLCSSLTVHLALRNVKQERQAAFRQMLIATLLLSFGFILVQFPSLILLLQLHDQFQEGAQRVFLYGLVVFMIVVHGAHVIGGIIPLTVITFKAQQGVYDHEHYGPVLYTATYWHFLDIVWIVMFGTMFLLG